MSVYTLPDLKYDYGELEPNLSAKILQLHHDKHHAAYVTGLNAAYEKLQKAAEAGDYAAAEVIARDLAFHGSGPTIRAPRRS